jgi:peptidoglycan/LPS O-acetylase OafA/YrhL
VKPGDIQEYRPEIDGLRALAVLAVLGYHAFPGTVTGGFVGVDVFFVISGFLITSIILRAVDQGSFSFLGFYARRARRIFPALIIILVLCYAAGWFELWAGEFKRLGEHIVAAAGFASNVVLWKETGYFDAGSETKPLLHLWSLGIEEQYYLIWPFLVWGAARFRRSLPALMWLIFGGSFALGIVMLHDRQAAGYYLQFPRFAAVRIGRWPAYSTQRSLNPRRSV